MDKANGRTEKFYCNLHNHTLLSDGKLSEEELIQLAIEKLGTHGVFAITDHNVVTQNFKELAGTYANQITLISGCEVSVSHCLSTGKKVHLHINFLFFDPDNQDLKDMLKTINGDSDGFLLESLRVLEEKTTFRMTLTELKEKFKGCKQIGRKHLAVCLVEQGLYESETDALDYCIGRMYEPFCYVDSSKFFPDDLDMEKALYVGKAAKALVTLNHPLFYNLKESELKELVHSFVMLCRRIGLPFAMEIEYSPYSKEQRAELYLIKEAYEDMLVSCGSDYHGHGKDEIEAFPGDIYLKLKEGYDIWKKL